MIPPSLERVLRDAGRLALAVSGGVDSMTLAHAAHRLAGTDAEVFHAVSPAVPATATRRVERHAVRAGWRLHLIDAGELDDPRYRANPVDRCYHCKARLYDAIRAHTGRQIVSGTNRDDLDDFRPGLTAAAERGVRHPLVEAGIDKDGVRRLARHLGLDDLAELPASPCLASRVETGLAIEPRLLGLIEAVESRVADALDARDVRCRWRRAGVVVELDEASLGRLDDAARARLEGTVAEELSRRGFEAAVRFAPYRTGSAFLRVVS